MHSLSRYSHVPRSMSLASIVMALLMWAVGCGQREATVVRIYNYQVADDGSTLVAIQAPEGETLATYSVKERLKTEYHYNPYNPMQVAQVTSETYIMMDNGTDSLGLMFTELDPYGTPETIYLIAPDHTAIGEYSFSRGGGGRVTRWKPEILTSRLPCHLYAYDGKELVAAFDAPEDCVGAEVGHKDSTNVILSNDGESIRAVLPRMRVGDGEQVYELGFRFVDRLEGDSLLPYYWNLSPGQQKLTIYDIVPSFAKKDFQRLARN